MPQFLAIHRLELAARNRCAGSASSPGLPARQKSGPSREKSHRWTWQSFLGLSQGLSKEAGQTSGMLLRVFRLFAWQVFPYRRQEIVVPLSIFPRIYQHPWSAVSAAGRNSVNNNSRSATWMFKLDWMFPRLQASFSAVVFDRSVQGARPLQVNVTIDQRLNSTSCSFPTPCSSTL